MPPARPNVRPWAIAGAALVLAGILASLVTGGGAGDRPQQIPPGGQMTVVRNAPPPRPGDKVLAAGQTKVHGLRYRVVVSTPDASGPPASPVRVFLNELIGQPANEVDRFRVQAAFYRDSLITSFTVHAAPEANPGNKAEIALSWFHHLGDRSTETRRFRATPHGVEVY